jgi:hypothetical protein
MKYSAAWRGLRTADSRYLASSAVVAGSRYLKSLQHNHIGYSERAKESIAPSADRAGSASAFDVLLLRRA